MKHIFCTKCIVHYSIIYSVLENIAGFWWIEISFWLAVNWSYLENKKQIFNSQRIFMSELLFPPLFFLCSFVLLMCIKVNRWRNVGTFSRNERTVCVYTCLKLFKHFYNSWKFVLLRHFIVSWWLSGTSWFFHSFFIIFSWFSKYSFIKTTKRLGRKPISKTTKKLWRNHKVSENH